MPSRRSPKKAERNFLSMSLEPAERELFERAARLEDLALSVWGRKVLLGEARRVVGEEKQRREEQRK